MFREGYCRRCSIEKEDIRTLKVEGGLIICTNCGNALEFIRVKNTPFFYLKEVEQIARR